MIQSTFCALRLPTRLSPSFSFYSLFRIVPQRRDPRKRAVWGAQNAVKRQPVSPPKLP
jgi:hypothetical protein